MPGAGRPGSTVGLVADGFGRAFSVDFGQSLAPRRPDFKLSGAIGGLIRQQSAASHTTALSLVTAPGAGRGDALAGLSFHDAQAARTLAASVVTRLDARTRIGFAAGRGTSGLLAGERGDSGHAMLIGDGAHDGLGFAASPGIGSMLRHDIAANHYVSIVLEDGWVSGSRWQDDPLLRYRSGRDSRYQRVGAAWDARFGPAARRAGRQLAARIGQPARRAARSRFRFRAAQPAWSVMRASASTSRAAGACRAPGAKCGPAPIAAG